MKIPSKGPVWGLIVGIPFIAICLVGAVAAALSVICAWVVGQCERWSEDLWR